MSGSFGTRFRKEQLQEKCFTLFLELRKNGKGKAQAMSIIAIALSIVSTCPMMLIVVWSSNVQT